MKTSKFTLLLIPFLFTFTFSTAQNIEKTLIKSFNLKGNDFVELDLNGQVEVKEWSNSLMRVHVTVGIETGSDAMLKSLVTAGRYNLKASDTAEGLLIDAPSLARTITVRGVELKENITYVVYKPEGVTLRLTNEASSNNNNTVTKNPANL
ncbi:MAG: hypothetical protein ACI9XO_004355 [Paraglaciecola sp.]|jgi:hypothetical protein